MTKQGTTACGLTLLLSLLCGCRSPETRLHEYLARGKALLQKHQYSRAILEFRNAAKAMPTDAEPYYEMGVASEATGDVRTAVVCYRKALSQNPKHTGAQLRLAQMMALTNDKALLQNAETSLNALKNSSSNSSDVLNSLALTELKLGKTDAAAQDLNNALANAPQELASSILLAQTKLKQQDVKGAEGVLKQACEAAPKSAAARVALGEFYAVQKRTSEAEEQFQRALAIDSKNGPALVDLANLQRSLGRKQEAEQTFKRLAALGDDPYKSAYAQYLFEEGRRDEAVRQFERLAKESPDNRLARTQLVAAYEAVNRTADAQKVLDQALRENSKDLDALLQRAEIFVQLGKYTQADADLNEVIHLRPNSADAHYVRARLYRAWRQNFTYRQELSEALRLNPFLLPVRLELAESYVHDTQVRAALDTLDAAPADQRRQTECIVQRNWVLWDSGDLAEMRKGIDQGLAQERSADLLIQDGLWKLQKGNPSGARVSLEEALKINPADVRALSGLSQTYSVQKQDSAAIQKVKEYAAREPNSAAVQEFLGTMLLVRGNRGEARAAFTAAKTADPHFQDADFSLVQADVVDGRIDDANKRLKAIIAVDSGNKTASLWLANIETMTGNYNPAEEHYRKVVEGNPTNAQALNNLAYLLAEHDQQLDEALKYAQKAVELAPDHPAYCDTLGWVLYRKGLYSEAVRYLERAAASKENVIWDYHLAMAYAKAGDSARGRSTLQAALKLKPNLPEAKTAQQVIGSAR